jgi:hypothetical protein
VLAAAATVNADFLAAVGGNTSVPGMLQVGVPVNSTATGEAGSTVHETGSVGKLRSSSAKRELGSSLVGLASLVAGGLAVLW